MTTPILLGDYCNFIGGSAFPERYQGEQNGDYPFIKVSDMKLQRNFFKINIANNWVSEDTAMELKVKVIPAGSIVFAKIGLGLYRNRFRVTTIPTIIDNNMMAAIPKPGVTSGFLLSVFETLDMQTWAVGAALPYLREVDLNNIKLDHIQVDRLAKVCKIEMMLKNLLDRDLMKIQEIEQQLDCIFMELFIRSQKNLKDCDQVVKTIDELCEISRGYSYSGSELSELETETPMINLACVLPGGGYNKDGLKFLVSEAQAKHVLQPNEILIATVDLTPNLRYVGSPMYIPSNLLNVGVASQDLARLKVKSSEITLAYLYYFIKFHRGILMKWSSGTTVSRFPIKLLSTLKVVLPEKKDLATFDHLFSLYQLLKEQFSIKRTSFLKMTSALKSSYVSDCSV